MRLPFYFAIVIWFIGSSACMQKPGAGQLPKSAYVQARGGLNNFYRAVAQKQNITVAYLGGSITYNKGWRDKTSSYLKEQFPQKDFTFINAGIPSLGSLPHAFRFEQDVLNKGIPDLLFVEAAVNDHTNETDSLMQIWALEGIVRHAKKANPAVDIVMMAFADPDKTADYAQGKVPLEVQNQELVAAHYKLPSINLAKEVADRLQAKEFSWEDDFKDLHPSPFGQELYYQTIRYLLDSTYKSYQTAKPGSKKTTHLPQALEGISLDKGRYVSVKEAHIQNGWQLIENWKPADGAGTREGFVNVPVLEATSPEALLTFEFTGNALGLSVVSGPDTGEISYKINNGPWQKMDLYTQWSSGLHLPWYKLLAAGLINKKHTLYLKMSESKNPKSTGTACRIVHFLVNDGQK
ncbi:SGNH/GDSL hydrolase family protein [Emticicia fluvialis]|uniref:SGNH/GDSL hydrolase family protein n=1 Tax=Emticicia fluvialis TaxID=2974474 RepID=UPI00216573E6|nr:SGNH/GDSL hydrolase family protein [Emticicia fluvialis]